MRSVCLTFAAFVATQVVWVGGCNPNTRGPRQGIRSDVRLGEHVAVSLAPIGIARPTTKDSDAEGMRTYGLGPITATIAVAALDAVVKVAANAVKENIEATAARHVATYGGAAAGEVADRTQDGMLMVSRTVDCPKANCQDRVHGFRAEYVLDVVQLKRVASESREEEGYALVVRPRHSQMDYAAARLKNQAQPVDVTVKLTFSQVVLERKDDKAPFETTVKSLGSSMEHKFSIVPKDKSTLEWKPNDNAAVGVVPLFGVTAGSVLQVTVEVTETDPAKARVESNAKVAGEQTGELSEALSELIKTLNKSDEE